MAQYRVGTVSVVSGSPWVSGAGTLFDSVGIEVGSLFNLEGINGWYYVGSVSSNSALTLTANYSGSTQYNQSYIIVRDYLTPQHIPLMHKGDINWTSIFNEAMLRIQASLTSSAGTGLDAAYDVENTVTVDSDPVIFNRVGYYGSSQNANAFRIVDQTSSGPSGMPSMDGALQYIYSKHRIPLIAVTNEADRGLPSSPSDTSHAAIIGIAYADDHDYFPDTDVLTNVGMAAYSVDYHGTYSVGALSNVGLMAYSQRGYGVAAYSASSYAMYTRQLVSSYGIYSEAALPLTVTNQAFGGASSSFAINVLSRRAGINIESTEAGVAGSPLLKITTTGRALETVGQAVLSHSGTALEVSGGSPTYPAVNIATTTAIGLRAYSTSYYGIYASSGGRPSIKAVNGIATFTDDVADITVPEAGTIVYSDAESGLKLYDGSDWLDVSTSETGAASVTLQEAYDAGRTITIPAGPAVPVSITSTDELSLSVQNTNVVEARDAIYAYSYSGWGVSISSNAATSARGGIKILGNQGTCISASASGPFASYTTTGVSSNHAMVMNCGSGGGIKVITAGEASSGIGPLYLQSDVSTAIDVLTETGKLINYLASSGATAGDGYAITAACGAGGGALISRTGGTNPNMRLVNTGSTGYAMEVSCTGGDGINISGVRRGMSISAGNNYAIYATSPNFPAVKSNLGIVASAASLSSIANPEGGTIVYQGWDNYCYYYSEASAQWIQFAVADADMVTSIGGDRGNNVIIKGQWSAATNVASFLAPFTGYITKARLSVDTPPEGANILVDINNNNTSIFGFGGDLLEIVEDEYSSNTIMLTDQTVSQYDIINIDIDQVGSTVPGGGDTRLIIYFGVTDTYAARACDVDYCASKVDTPAITGFVEHDGRHADVSFGVLTGTGFGAYCGDAKVEIGNSILYLFCTIKHEQEITYWTDTEIRFGANVSGLNVSAPLGTWWYIWVTDACGTRSLFNGPH